MATATDSLSAVPPHLAAFGTGDIVFVDANVLVYSTVPAAPFHRDAFDALTALGAAGVELCVSRQVLREYMAALTRPQSYTPALPFPAVERNVRRFEAGMRVAEDGPAVFARLLGLLGSVPCGGKRVYDANVVATMLAHGVPNVLTHNVADFRRLAAHVAVVPLVP
jgi:predicted nucleic acid-binding protein